MDLGDDQHANSKQAQAKGCWSHVGAALRTTYAASMFCGMQILLKCIGVAMPNYTFQFVLAIAVGSTAFFAGIWCAWDLSGRWFRGEPLLTVLDRAAVWRQAVVISFFISINYILVGGSNPYVNGPAEVLLSQFPSFLGLVCNWFFLRRPYSWWAWAGAFLLMCGGSSSIITMLGGTSTTGSTPLLWGAIFGIGMLPTGILAPVWEICYDPHVKGSDGRRITPSWQLFLINVFVTILLLALSPAFGVMASNPWPDMQAANACVFRGEAQDGSDCGNAIWILVPMIVIVSLQMHSQAILSGYESGAWANLVNGIAPFGADVVFPFLPGAYGQSVSPWDALGIGLSLVGLVMFAHGERVMASDPARSGWRVWSHPWPWVRVLIPGTQAHSGEGSGAAEEDGVAVPQSKQGRLGSLNYDASGAAAGGGRTTSLLPYSSSGIKAGLLLSSPLLHHSVDGGSVTGADDSGHVGGGDADGVALGSW